VTRYETVTASTPDRDNIREAVAAGDVSFPHGIQRCRNVAVATVYR